MREEKELNQAFHDLPVSPAHRLNIRAYLALLKIKHPPTYLHSIRVGLLCLQAAEALGFNRRALFWGGTLHDIGKALIDTRVLSKTDDFSERDYTAVRPHPVFGYRLLQGVHPYTAELVVRHHRFQPCPYPRRLPQSQVTWPKKTLVKIERQARLLALMDFYDALTRRRNNKFVGRGETKKNLRVVFYDHNPNMASQIDKLIKNDVISF